MTMWDALRAALRVIGTRLGIVHEPAFIAVRVHRAADDAEADRAA